MAECLEVSPRGNKSRLKGIGETYVRFARTNPARYRLMFGEGFPVASKSGEAVRHLRQKAYET